MADAPGKPGIPPRWTSSAKTGIGTALSPASRVWFTLSHGILNEIYYPRVDQACTRDLGMIVTDGAGFFAEEKRDCDSVIQALEPGVPAFELTNTHRGGRFRILKHVISDPRHDVVLQRIALEDASGELRLFALLAPHLVNGGENNTAWIGEYKGQQMLFAEGSGTALALGASVPLRAGSAGYVGESDGWQTLHAHGYLAERWDRAEDGNVALTGEIDLSGREPVLLALGFGRNPAEAAFRVRASLLRGFQAAFEEYAAAWRAWQAELRPLDRRADGHNIYRVSTAVLRSHESPTFPGGLIASLSIPWGFSKGDDDLGGYHLVWPRDLVQTAGGFLACGAHAEAGRVLYYLRATQEADGSWPQNCWLDGRAYWGGLQLDECAFPILLLDLAWREGAIGRPALTAFWPMVRAAAGFIVRRGPITCQDRWEEDAGYSTFTLAVLVAALLAGADIAEMCEADGAAALLRDTADAWNEQIEDWTYAAGGRFAREAGVAGHYVRIGPALPGQAHTSLDRQVNVRNRDGAASFTRADELVSPDALALVRFGLRAADDPRIRDTVAVIDRVTRTQLPQGPGWHRYNGDGYGEKADGEPFDGTGIGRVWPLLAGERAHYELAGGRRGEAERLLGVLEAAASPGGLLPEQVWDADPIPARELFPGKPSGSAMPLVWAHAEHLKLLRSLAENAVFDMPPQTVRRYVRGAMAARCRPWRPDFRSATIPAGKTLRIDLSAPATLHWSADGWAKVSDTPTQDTGLGLHTVEIPTAGMKPGTRLSFTWRWTDTDEWAGQDYAVTLA